MKHKIKYKTGLYKNQFETTISSGNVSPFIGGYRDSWENEVFKKAYKDSNPTERPKYGSSKFDIYRGWTVTKIWVMLFYFKA